VRISSTTLVKKNGGGSYVTGMIEPLFGYAAPIVTQVSVAAYGVIIAVWTFRRVTRGDLCPEGGDRTQPRAEGRKD
jgi:hypothetical protein